jgi:hypothetical protein
MEKKRKPISKKTRFEVFKRDNFTCQYCGKSSPDVILEVDHINPVSKGGDNDIVNLITACRDCNSGKGARQLSDNEVLKKQQKQLEELNERRQQMQMMVEWKEELAGLDDEMIDKIQDIYTQATGNIFTDYGRGIIRKLIKKCGFSEVYESARIAIEQYNSNLENAGSVVFNYIERICHSRWRDKSDPMASKRFYIRGILRNRLPYFNNAALMPALNDFMKNEEDFEYIKSLAEDCRSWSHFINTLNEAYEEE